MNTCFDSAVIAKLYVQESNSADAVQLVSAVTAPYPLTHWQDIEVRNALRLKLFRHEITADQLQASLTALDEDIMTGRWQRPAYALADVHDRAAQLSDRHSAQIGCRTLDIFHVAAALIIGTPEFVSFDARQCELARQEGLKVKP